MVVSLKLVLFYYSAFLMICLEVPCGALVYIPK